MTKRRGKVAILVGAALMLLLGVTGCTRSTYDWQKRGGPPHVVVTIPALDNFVRNVGGEHVGIVCLCTTEGPHHYQDRAEDAILLRDADLFFAVGLTLDDKFADSIQLHSHNPHLRYVKLGEQLPKDKLLANKEDHDEDEHEGHEGHEGHSHGKYDPHVWLGIPQAIKMVEIIRDELIKADPNHEDDYRKNADRYVVTLQNLEKYGQSKLKDKKNRKLIAFHESLGYFAKSFDLNVVGVIEVVPGAEADAEHRAKLTKLCKSEDVRVIATEPQYPRETAESLRTTIKTKTGKDVEFAVVDPLETVADKSELSPDGKEVKDKEWYDKKMRKNLDNLARTLP